jgi:hypothetical protein
LGVAPALAHNSYQILTFATSLLDIDHDNFSKQLKDAGKIKQPEFKKVTKKRN